MDFEEWCKNNMPEDAEDIDIAYAKMGWKGAIETALFVIENSGVGGPSDDYVKDLIRKLL